MDEDESFKSPELQRLEEEVKQMEAAMDAAHQGLEEYQVDNNYAENESDVSLFEDDIHHYLANNNDDRSLSPGERLSPASLVLAVAASAATTTSSPPNSSTNDDDYNRTLSSTSYADALKTHVLLCTSIKRGLGLAFVIIFFSVIAQMYPTAPQSDCYVALLLALLQIKPLSEDKEMTHIVSLVSIIVMTIVFDIDWLIGNYFVQSLGENDNFEFELTQGTSFVWQMAWWAVAINIFVKILSLNEFLNVWSHVRGYFVSNMKDISASVSQKVILVAWIEVLSSLLLLVYFFLIQFDLVSGRLNVFSEAPVQILSVQATLLSKVTSGIFVFLSLVHHIKIRDLCGQCRCGSSYFCVADTRRQTRRSRKKIVSSLKRSLKCIAFTKAFDFVLGVMLWISLVNAQTSIQYDAPKDVKVMSIVMSVTNSFTSLTPLLVGSIIWSIRLSEKQREESRQEAMSQNTRIRTASRDIRSADRRSIASADTSAYDSYSYDFGNLTVRSSQSLFSTRLDAASPAPSAPPIQQQQQQTHQYLDLDLYCTPREFESEWQGLSRGSHTEEYPISTIPSLSQCNLHFNQVGWSIIASGVVDNVTKLFLIAQRRIQMPVSRSGNTHSSLRMTTASRCLAQLSVDDMNSIMTLEMRSRNEDQIDFFISSLELTDLSSVE